MIGCVLIFSSLTFAFAPNLYSHVLTSLICNVTGMHELVGQISDYFVHPKICGTTLRKGKEIDSIQMYKLNCTLV